MFLGVGIGLALMVIPYSVHSSKSLDGSLSCGLPALEVVRRYLEPTDCFHQAVLRVTLGGIIGFVLVGLGVFATYLRARNGPASVPRGS